MDIYRKSLSILIAIFLLTTTALPSAADSDSDSSFVSDECTAAPPIGIPYSSVTEDGNIFSGAVRIDRFEADGDELIVIGALLDGDQVHETVFPVKVIEASCDVLQLEIGPPNGPGAVAALELQTPLLIVETPMESDLRQVEFCQFSTAIAAGDMVQIASELNETEEIAAGSVSASCPWYKQIECAFAVTSCRSICTLFTPASPLCKDCFNDLNQGNCISCLFF